MTGLLFLNATPMRHRSHARPSAPPFPALHLVLHPALHPAVHRCAAAGLAVAAALLGGCGSLQPLPEFTPHAVDASATFSRPFDATDVQACEAARRALLSQGYLVTSSRSDFVNARKSFQPAREMHVEIDFRVTCAPEGDEARTSLVFVNAQQDRYALKKTNSSASLGVGALGSLSLPLASSDDALVKVASQTIDTPEFYGRFFVLIDRYLGGGGGGVTAN